MSFILEALEKNQKQEVPNKALAIDYQQSNQLVKASSQHSLAWGVLLTIAILSALLLGFWLGQSKQASFNEVVTNAQVTNMKASTKVTSTKAAQTIPADNNGSTQVGHASQINSVINSTSTPVITNKKMVTNNKVVTNKKIAAESYFEQPPVITASNRIQEKSADIDSSMRNVNKNTNKSALIAVSDKKETSSLPVEFSVTDVEGVSDDLLARFKTALKQTETTNKKAKSEVKEQAEEQIKEPQATIKPLAEMPSWVQNGVPSLQFDMHIYASDGEGWVKVNGKDRYENDTIAKGVVLEKIEPQQVILQYKGERFTLPALANW